MTERPPGSEFSENEQLLIARLREHGHEDPEALLMLNAWCDEQKLKANEINTAGANIEVDLRRAKLYRAAGFHRDALDSLEAARESAHNAGEKDLYEQAMALMDEIDEELGRKS